MELKNNRARKLVMAALFAALACIMTMSVRIPTPGTGGYIHPGDAVVILCGIFLNPAFAFLAAGLGSSMADLLGGYFIYVPITFVIKGLAALCAHFVYRLVSGKMKNPFAAAALCSLPDIALVAGGYFLFEVFMYGAGAALASTPSNLIQGAGGLVISTVLYPMIAAVPEVKRRMAV